MCGRAFGLGNPGDRFERLQSFHPSIASKTDKHQIKIFVANSNHRHRRPHRYAAAQ
jgi:hypothetical protein